MEDAGFVSQRQVSLTSTIACHHNFIHHLSKNTISTAHNKLSLHHLSMVPGLQQILLNFLLSGQVFSCGLVAPGLEALYMDTTGTLHVSVGRDAEEVLNSHCMTRVSPPMQLFTSDSPRPSSSQAVGFSTWCSSKLFFRLRMYQFTLFHSRSHTPCDWTCRSPRV
ncbi:unnamed protein product [Somion occarium]|uniref:Uncharacterized protein n=1 Tax=Somion occarium TaxID=3059160 RepID=A0ABP1CJ91_9APHY